MLETKGRWKVCPWSVKSTLMTCHIHALVWRCLQWKGCERGDESLVSSGLCSLCSKPSRWSRGLISPRFNAFGQWASRESDRSHPSLRWHYLVVTAISEQIEQAYDKHTHQACWSITSTKKDCDKDPKKTCHHGGRPSGPAAQYLSGVPKVIPKAHYQLNKVIDRRVHRR